MRNMVTSDESASHFETHHNSTNNGNQADYKNDENNCDRVAPIEEIFLIDRHQIHKQKPSSITCSFAVATNKGDEERKYPDRLQHTASNDKLAGMASTTTGIINSENSKQCAKIIQEETKSPNNSIAPVEQNITNATSTRGKKDIDVLLSFAKKVCCLTYIPFPQ
jgi:hypothetical protein